MVPYPTELRSRVVAAVEQGELTIGEVAQVFSVGVTFVKRMLRLQRAGEDLAPRHSGGSAPKLTESDRELLRETVARDPDVTLAECQTVLSERGSGGVSVPTICRALQQLELPRKKKSRRQ
jgi:transposase